MSNLVAENLNEFFEPRKGKKFPMGRFNELKREEMVDILIGSTVNKVEYKNLSGKIILHLDNGAVSIAPNGGADPGWDSTAKDIEDIKGTIADIKDDFYEISFTFEDGLAFDVYDPTGGEGLDFWAEDLNERIIKGKDNEGHRYGSKKSHWDKQGFKKLDWERSGKESYKGDVVSLLKHDHYEYDVKENKTPEDEAVLAYIERIASWLDIEL